MQNDPVNHPKHYTSHPSDVECIEVTRSMSFNNGSAFKYVFRRDDKENAVQDLKKALWYVQDELAKRQKWGYTFMSKLLLPFYMMSRQDEMTEYWKRTTLIIRICRYEAEPIIADIYRLLNIADHEFYSVHHLQMLAFKLQFLIDKYQTIKNINDFNEK